MDKTLLIVSSLLMLSEVLGLIPAIRVNGVFDIIVQVLKRIKNG